MHVTELLIVKCHHTLQKFEQRTFNFLITSYILLPNMWLGGWRPFRNFQEPFLMPLNEM